HPEVVEAVCQVKLRRNSERFADFSVILRNHQNLLADLHSPCDFHPYRPPQALTLVLQQPLLGKFVRMMLTYSFPVSQNGSDILYIELFVTGVLLLKTILLLKRPF
ncbi:MAG: hypothetical protein KIY12_06275, partial [Thermoplasmata archaeon]|nr:hypothetical protein [Candidatus Sysuiplasma superficiale]